MKNIQVSLDQDRSYPIYIISDQLSIFSDYFSQLNLGKKTVVIYQDSTTAYADLVSTSLSNSDYDVFRYCIEEGESAKSWDVVKLILDFILDLRLERQDTLIAVGGGVVGDLVGFVASIYLRGINFVQVPTTLLSQVDASVGGKTGINHAKGKNLIGAFYQPKMVMIDMTTLLTLSSREMRSGLSEVVKYGMIMDSDFFQFIETHLDVIKSLDVSLSPDTWAHLISVSCQSKAKVVSLDEKESGVRAILNFGHTIGHAIESVYNYTEYTHGECVALGMKAAMHLALQRGLVTLDDYNRLITVLTALSLPLTIPSQSYTVFLDKMKHDKKVVSNQIRFVLPTDIGTVEIVNDVMEDEITDALSVIMSTKEVA